MAKLQARYSTYVKFPRFRDPNGHATCSIGNSEQDTCTFYRRVRFGMEERCLIDGGMLKRRDNGLGYLIPCSGCILVGGRDKI